MARFFFAFFTLFHVSLTFFDRRFPLTLLNGCLLHCYAFCLLAVFHSNLPSESLSYSKTMPNFYVNRMISWESFSKIFPEPKEPEVTIFSQSVPVA